MSALEAITAASAMMIAQTCPYHSLAQKSDGIGRRAWYVRVCTGGRSGPYQIVRGGQRGGQMAETVSLNKDGRRATITGRKRASLQQKMNPVWWFMNSSEQTVNEAPCIDQLGRTGDGGSIGAFAIRYKICALSWLAYPIRLRSHRARPGNVRPAERFTALGDRFSVVRAARRRPSGAPVLRELQWETSCLVFRSSADWVFCDVN